MALPTTRSRGPLAGSSTRLIIGIAETRRFNMRHSNKRQRSSSSSFKSASSSSVFGISRQLEGVGESVVRMPVDAAGTTYTVSTQEAPSAENLETEAYAVPGIDISSYPVANDERASMEEVTDNTYLSDISYLSQEDIVNGTVDISGCRLTCIFPQIGHFSNITHMQLSDNLLTVLPDDIGHLRQLQYIDISYNQLETLPATIAYWQSLRVMKADSNCLTGLPMSIRHIPQLCEVDLSANLLETVPAGLWTMHSLHTLNLSYNLIRVVPARIFAPNGTAAQNSTKKDALCLDGCPIGSGFADCIDKPSTVYTSRFSHGVAIHDPNGPIQPNHKRLPSLSDIVVCKMANNNAAYPHSLLEHIQARLDKLLICDYCHKLYPAESGSKRWRLLYRNNAVLPVEYNFCSPHWSNEKQRIVSLFSPCRLESSQPYYDAKQAAVDLAQLRLSRPTPRKNIFSSSNSLVTPPLTASFTKKTLRRLFRTSRSESQDHFAPLPIWQVFEDDIPDLPDLEHTS